MSKPQIAFVTGGYSSEAVISYKSAITIQNNVDKEKYDVYRIDITPQGWFYSGPDGVKTDVDKNDFSIIHEGRKVNFDAVLIGIHGTPGEDGKLQGYFDLVNLPYTSCDATSSAITFNKRYTVAVAAFAGINVSRSLHIFRHTPVAPEDILKQLKLPVMVKPSNGGSSIGMSKVNKEDDLTDALEKAFKEDDQLLIEEFITGREFTIGVFKSKDEVLTLPFTEVFTFNDFFDFEAKYQGKSEEKTPAECDEGMAKKVRDTATRVYKIFNCRGVVRMDFIYNAERDEPFLLEINTVPGQSEMSVVPMQVRARGWDLKDFYSMLIEDALGQKKG
jgi:D-alanine-D-alanine ligase